MVIQESNNKTNLVQRIITAIILIPIVIGSILFSPTLLQLILILISIGMFNEWYDITSSKRLDLIWGIPTIAIPISCLILLPILVESYKYVLITYLSIIWTVDSAAMFGGRKFKGPKLAPILSPNKTWSGLFCGVIGGACIAQLVSFLPGYEFPYHGTTLMIFAICLGIIAQISDLYVSFFKRKFHIKDSGTIVPGHGGLLDRCDSLLLTAPLILYIAL